MKTYKCDSCGVEIKEPYIEKMKEFCLSGEIDEHGVFPKPWKKKIKVHLCKHCFRGLYIIVKRKDMQMVYSNDTLIRDNKKYLVVTADDNVFVACPIIFDKEENSEIIKYDKAEIYANQESINTLEELRFENLTTKIKLCPHCDEAELYVSDGGYSSGYENNGYRISCKCGFAWKKINWEKTKEEAIKKWNKIVEDNIQ